MHLDLYQQLSDNQRPPSIDARMQSVLETALQDSDFKNSWESVHAYYGNHPTITLTSELKTCRIGHFCSAPAFSGENWTFRVLRSPTLVCCDRFFPALPTLNLITHIFSLHTTIAHPELTQESRNTHVAMKVLSWTMRNQFPGGLLELATASEKDEATVVSISPLEPFAKLLSCCRRFVTQTNEARNYCTCLLLLK